MSKLLRESNLERDLSPVMSFWPFSNSLNNNSHLQKFLDSIQDFTAVSSEDFLEDPILLQELIRELHNVKSNYSNNYTSFQFLQQSENFGSGNAYNSDAVSLTSSNNDSSNNNVSKDARGAKLLEILLQPHILNGFLDYIVNSVEFFHDLNLKEAKELEELIQKPSKDEHVEEQHGNESLGESERDQSKDDLDAITRKSSNEEQEGMDEESKDDKSRRFIQASSDILSIDLWVILNRIIETPVIMGKLWLMLSLQNLQESSPSVAYLVHILNQLMDTNSIELLNFIRRQPDLVDTFLEKIEIPMLMDFFLRIIQTDKQDSPTGILETLHLQNLMIKLVEILKPHPSQFVEGSSKIPNHNLFFKQTAATDFIKALVTVSSNTALAVVLETNIGPNQLTRELVSPKIINSMIHDIMLYKYKASPDAPEQTNKHGINNCVGIIVELIRKNNSDYDLNCGSYSSMLNHDGIEGSEVNSYVMYQWLKDFEQNTPGPRDPIYLGDMLYLFSENLEHFSELMDVKPLAPIKVEDKSILGFTKFKISELIAELLHCSNMILLNSKRIRKVIHLRDYVRQQQSKRLKKALEESIVSHETNDGSDCSIHDVTSGLDEISLDDIHDEPLVNESEPKHKNKEDEMKDLLESLENEEASDDDEPCISSENPFVCDERDKNIRANPCVGDFFKTKLIDSKILFRIISKFTQYPWHNFFHNVVFDLIQQIFNGKLNSYNSFLIVDLFKPDECDLTKLIVNTYQDTAEPRPGYMGHLILISEEVVKFSSLYKPDLISPIIVQSISSERWEWFVNDVLLKTREIYNVVLGAEQDEQDDEEEHHRMNKSDQDHDTFGFDSSTVGYLDLETYDNHSDKKSSIILGDRNNHEAFINDQHDNVNEEEDNMEDAKMPDVRIQNMSPSRHLDQNDTLDDDYDHNTFPDGYQDNDFLNNLSGSSSSDDDDDDDDSNELRRVPKHND